jgi:hypothetical protein
MARNPKEVAKPVIEKLLARVPEAQREAVRAELLKDEVLDEFGTPLVQVADQYDAVQQAVAAVNKQKADTDSYREQLNQWFIDQSGNLTKGSAALEELERLKAGGDHPAPGVTTSTAPDLSKYITKDEAAKGVADILSQKDQFNMYLASKVPSLVIDHYDKFKEKLNPQDLFNHAGKMRTNDLDAAYADLFKDKITAATKKAEDDRIESAVKERLSERLAKLKMPYPTDGGVESVSSPVLDGMKSKDQSQYGVQAAVDEYYRSQRAN